MARNALRHGLTKPISSAEFNRMVKRLARQIERDADASGPNLTVRFAWGFPEALAYASLGDARANEDPIEPSRPQQA
jgi:hypothetical protein